MKILVSHINHHQKVIFVEDEFNSQADRRTHSVDRQSLFIRKDMAFLSSPNGLMNKVAIVAEMRVMHGLKDMDFHSPRLTWLQLLLSARSANNREQH